MGSRTTVRTCVCATPRLCPVRKEEEEEEEEEVVLIFFFQFLFVCLFVELNFVVLAPTRAFFETPSANEPRCASVETTTTTTTSQRLMTTDDGRMEERR